MPSQTHPLLLALLALASSGVAARAETPVGVWRTETSTRGAYVGAAMDVRIAPCSGAAAGLCGVVDEVYGTDRRDAVGQVVLRGMVADGTDRWSGGTVWVMTRDKTYDARMALVGGQLRVEGCVAVVCQGQTWTRVE